MMTRPAVWIKDAAGLPVGVKRMGARVRRRWDRERSCPCQQAHQVKWPKPGHHAGDCLHIAQALRPILLLGLLNVLRAVVARRLGR